MMIKIKIKFNQFKLHFNMSKSMEQHLKHHMIKINMMMKMMINVNHSKKLFKFRLLKI